MPVTAEFPPATMAMAGSMPTSGSPRCMDPPLPAAAAGQLPNSSAMAALGNALGQRVSVRTVRRCDPIAARKIGARAYGDGFLTLVLVQRPRNPPRKNGWINAIFEVANQDHVVIQAPVEPNGRVALRLGSGHDVRRSMFNGCLCPQLSAQVHVLLSGLSL